MLSNLASCLSHLVILKSLQLFLSWGNWMLQDLMFKDRYYACVCNFVKMKLDSLMDNIYKPDIILEDSSDMPHSCNLCLYLCSRKHSGVDLQFLEMLNHSFTCLWQNEKVSKSLFVEYLCWNSVSTLGEIIQEF